MPRNNSGSYTTPAGQPVTSGTTISAATHNALVGDLATELTDSLSRSGKGGMSAPLRTPDGNAAAPAHSFTSETGTGVFRKGAANPAMAVTGSEKQEWTATGTNITGNAAVSGNETVGGTLGVTGNTTLGGTLGVTGAATVGGTLGVTGDATLAENLTVQGATGLTLTAGDVAMTEAAAQAINKSNGDLTMGTVGADSVSLWTNSTQRLTIASGGDITAAGNLTVQGATGVVASGGNVALTANGAQAIAKSTAGDLTISNATAASINFSTDNTLRWYIDSTGVLVSASKALTGLPAPSDASDAATKGYVDTAVAGTSTATANALMRRDAAGRVAIAAPSASGDAATKGYVDGLSDGTASLSAEANWSVGVSKGLFKQANGIVALYVEMTAGAAAGNSIVTLPAGYRPTFSLDLIARDISTTTGVLHIRVNSSGLVSAIAGQTITNGHGYAVFATYKAA